MSGLIDRFVCRREGHVPAFTLLPGGTVKITTYVTYCTRCGATYEVRGS